MIANSNKYQYHSALPTESIDIPVHQSQNVLALFLFFVEVQLAALSLQAVTKGSDKLKLNGEKIVST